MIVKSNVLSAHHLHLGWLKIEIANLMTYTLLNLYLIESSKGHFGMGHAGHLAHLAHNLETHFLKNITSKRKHLKSRLRKNSVR